ncbi:MAG TPA: thioredoxin domain-containing protein, partial [Nitratifractor salsuginis]|nr:thioredoxin domain-containing protein [Nitratifractor salsuginis]
DREEHPQIDRYYQQVHRLLTRRPGGWPLTLLLTPDRKPFFAATYLPREAKYNQPGLLELLEKAAKLWQKEPATLERIGEEILTLMQRIDRREQGGAVAVDEKLSRRFVEALRNGFDTEKGGWGMAPKFPRAATLTALLQIYRLTGNRQALQMADQSLLAMALGGIYDQVEGGFYRYSTDREWRIPHFEKMLYTNAELLEAYALAARLTGRGLYRRVVRETAAVLKEHYRDPSGLFYGASDADSSDPESGEKVEGFYYTYRYGRVFAAAKKAGIPHPEKALEDCGITENGNFIRFRSNPWLAEEGSCSPRLRELLKQLRSHRPYPFIDRKLQASWNALLIHGLFVASALDAAYGELGVETLKALRQDLDINGTLYHQKLPGHTPKVPALLEDYSFTVAAAIDAYEFTQDPVWLTWAEDLFARARKRFESGGIWYDAEGDFRNPLTLEGGAYRSPLAVLADDALRLAVLREKLEFRQIAEWILRRESRVLAAYPQAAPMGVLAWLADRYGYVVVKAPAPEMPRLKRRIEDRTLYP